MNRIGCLIAAVVLAAAGPKEQESSVKRMTPVLMVEEIEPVIAWWEALGFTKTLEVPEGDKLGFIAVEAGPVQIMYQSRSSVAGDVAEIAESPMGGTMLFIEVADLDAIADLLGDTPHVTPRRTTFYGADEIIVREPAGNIITFAEFGASEEGE